MIIFLRIDPLLGKKGQKRAERAPKLVMNHQDISVLTNYSRFCHLGGLNNHLSSKYLIFSKFSPLDP